MHAKYNSLLDLDRIQEDIPVIGILMQPWDEPGFPYSQITWEVNVNFIHYAGSYAAVVRYDLPDDELYELLDSLNGIHFPGGVVDMFGESGVGDPAPFYLTSKKIFQYAIDQFDKGRYFPIFGIC